MEKYLLGPSMGEGRFGSVRSAVIRGSGVPVAIKLINVTRVEEGIPHMVARELLVSMRLQHPYIIRTYEVFPYGSSVALVMERCATDLSAVLCERSPANPLSPQSAKSLFRMLLGALAYMHKEGILHRDVKPSNCFLARDGTLRLGDFGLSRMQDTEESMTHEVVSRWYRPPELLLGQRHYGPEVDMWSAGCVFVELLRGYTGAFFASDGDVMQLSRIFDVLGTPTQESWPTAELLPDWGKVHFEPKNPCPLGEFFPEASGSAVDLLRGLLCLDPSRRLSAADALCHTYFNEY
ncbi:protein kinase, putative [Trypanosoma equiperdum]|uniref:[RNA-polymerase]-subunit kinase n=2 Tax=Trypanozoon TaxID=39700 RepID=Q57V20_TRYB2|nr:protein kinase, putative [Trypanosoma brucei brucei TREU927]AAX70549.1 protein kinase, putative [Trypanosoma brucei]AAZ12255.1 protein kinase, putative [Trypanosoma brucei brucei TREU927]SCU71982.1 protein kinase, putative [Trypanosoma equiperdum]